MAKAKKNYKQLILQLVISLIPNTSSINRAYDLLLEILDDEEVIADLNQAIIRAQTCFEEECRKPENQDLPSIKLDWRMPNLAAEIKKLPQNVSLQKVKQDLYDRIMDTPGITDEQARKAAGVFELCLTNALGSMPEYTQNVILSKIEMLENRIIKLETIQHQPKTLEEMLKPLEFTRELTPNPLFSGRIWLLEKVKTWLADPRGPQLFWLTAEPGVGKTAFSAWLAGKLDNVAAVHFCNAGIPEKNDPARLVCSLAYQLSQRLGTGYSEYLLQQEIQKETDAGSLFDRFFVQPFARNGFAPTEEGHPLLIVIDGLDEANDPQAENRLAQLISQHAGCLPGWLRLLVTSRSHTQVMEWLLEYEQSELTKGSDENRDDLRVFIQDGLRPFNNGRELSSSLVETLLEKSEGVFLYIELLRRELEQKHLSIHEYQNFPRGLDGMYKKYFARQFPNREVYSQLIRPAFQLAAAAYEALPVCDLAEWLGWTEEMSIEFEEQTGGLFNLNNGYLATPHRTLLEWISNRKKAGSRYWADPIVGHKKLAEEGWLIYKKTGAKGLNDYFLGRLAFHLIVVKKLDELILLLIDLTFLDRLYKQNKYLLFEVWGLLDVVGFRIDVIFEDVIRNPEQHPPILLFRLALTLQQTGHNDMAEILYKWLIKLWREQVDILNLQSALGNLAMIFHWQGRMDDAILLSKEKEQICRKFNDQESLSRSLVNQAVILMDQNEQGKAMDLLKEAEKICRQLNVLDGIVTSLGNQAFILIEKGALEEAIPILNEIEQISRTQNYPNYLQSTLINQSKVFGLRGELREALRLQNEAEAICRQLNDPVGLNKATVSKAVTLMNLGEMGEAIQLLRQVEVRCRRMGDWENLIHSMINQVSFLGRQGDRAGAMELAQQALELAETHGYVVLAQQIRGVIDLIERQKD